MNNHIIPFSEILPAFCAVRNKGTFFDNGDATETTPRIVFLRHLLADLHLDYELDVWEMPNRYPVSPEKTTTHLFNIYLHGTGNKMVMAHHDVANHKVDNCNDNSASVINAIAAKILNPELNVAITDGEEFGGVGSQRVSDKIKEGHFGEIEYVVNLELTAVGGLNFFTEPYPDSNLYKKIMSIFPNTYTTRVPFHDGVILRRNGIDSLVLNPLPLDAKGKLDFSILYNCHTTRDTINLANYDDMDIFVKQVITPLIK